MIATTMECFSSVRAGPYDAEDGSGHSRVPVAGEQEQLVVVQVRFRDGLRAHGKYA